MSPCCHGYCRLSHEFLSGQVAELNKKVKELEKKVKKKDSPEDLKAQLKSFLAVREGGYREWVKGQLNQ